jgi:hypothetical protein
MTAAFAIGQIAGPVLVRFLGAGHPASGWGALDLANAAATVLLASTAAWLWREIRPSPPSPPSPPSTLEPSP